MSDDICSCTLQRRKPTQLQIGGAYHLLSQVQMDARQAQHEQKMIMHAQQLAARELHLVQQQARLTRKEAELHECQTAFQERVTAYSTTHSRLNGATSGCCSFAVSICCFQHALMTCCCSCLFALCIHASKSCLCSSQIASELLHKETYGYVDLLYTHMPGISVMLTFTNIFCPACV